MALFCFEKAGRYSAGGAELRKTTVGSSRMR